MGSSTYHPKVVIVGGGPAGLFAAWCLHDSNLDVCVHESRAQGEAMRESERAYSIILSQRSLEPLRRSGLDPQSLLDSGRALKFAGAVAHLNKGKSVRRRAFSNAANCIVVRRHVLTEWLFEKLKERGIRVEYGSHLVRIHDSDRIAYFSHAPQTTEEPTQEPQHLNSVKYDILVGADGANSAVRKELQRQNDQFVVDVEEDRLGYKPLCGIFPANMRDLPGFDQMKTDEDRAAWFKSMHVWRSGEAQILCVPTVDCEVNALIILERHNKQSGFDSQYFSSPEELKSLFHDLFPDVMAFDDISSRLTPSCKKLIQMPVFFSRLITCSALVDTSRSIALVGDAGYGVTPTLGQGVQAAFVGVVLLAQAFREHNLDTRAGICEALDSYNKKWLADAHAVVELSRNAFGGPKNRTISPWVAFKFAILYAVHALSFGLVSKPALAYLGHNELSYRQINKLRLQQERNIRMMLVALTGVSAWALFKYLQT